MTDEFDQANERLEFEASVEVANVCNKLKDFVEGQAGDCELCGEFFERVIRVRWGRGIVLSCGRCRDKYRIR